MENFIQTPVEQMQFERARKRVKAVSGFYKHLMVYLVINTGSIVVTALNLDGHHKFWSFETFSMAIFWGFGLLVHALSTFGASLFLGGNWEERKIREIMEKEKKQGKRWE